MNSRCLHERLTAQQGSALILAMLIAAVVAMLSIELAGTFGMRLDRVQAQQHSRLAQTYVQGAEQLALQLLRSDTMASASDSLHEPWASAIPPLPTDHGWLQVQISDAQALFNLNNLSVKTGYSESGGSESGGGGGGLSVPDMLRLSAAQKQFVRLLQSLEALQLSESQAIMMTEALIDWLDADDQATGQGGAESLFYSSMASVHSQGPVQPANQLLSDISELTVIRHFAPPVLAALRPWVTALPQPTPLNLNTAPLRLLATINAADQLQPLQTESLRSLDDYRGQVAFDAVADFFALPLLQSLVPQAETSSGHPELALYGVDSRWFFLDSTLNVNGSLFHWRSLLARDDAQVQVWSRERLY